MIINEKPQHGDLIETILYNNGIEDIDLFLNPNNKDDSDITKFTHIDLASKTLIYHLTKGSHISIVVDPDMDGFASSAILYRYLRDLTKHYGLTTDVSFILQEGKEHGLNDYVIDKLVEESPDLIILPDAATNDTFELMTLSTMGYEVLVIDHHEIEDEKQIDLIENVIIVNNQRTKDKELTNKWFTGAGMIYNFISSVDSYLTEDSNIEQYLDLVALGQIGDASDISDNEIRNIVFNGLDNINNPFVKSVLSAKDVKLNKVTPQDLSFSVIPIINSVTRIGTFEDRQNLFSALISDSEDLLVVPKRKLNKETRKYEMIDFSMTLTDKVADELIKVKTKQDTLVKKIVSELDKTTNNNQGILIYEMDRLESGSITGLVATKLSRKYDKPCLVLINNGEYKSGSARGIEKVLESFKDWCEDSDLFEFARGHANAFGVSIHSDHLHTLKDRVLEFDATPNNTYEVDRKYNQSVSKDDVDQVIKHKHIIGGKVQSPLFGFEDITIPKKYLSTRGKTIEFGIGGISFVMWQSPEELIEKLTSGFNQSIKVSFVGEPFEVNFSGKPQNKVVIKDMEIIEDNEEETFFF